MLGSLRPFLGISPFERPDSSLVSALCRAGAFGVLDLGLDLDAGLAAVDRLSRDVKDFGVRIPCGVTVVPAQLPPQVTTIILPAGADIEPWRDRTVLVQVTSLDQASKAVVGGADALIAKGTESGGHVGDQSAFVLMQALIDRVELPVWVQGGIGMHTASACIAGGAEGVVLDSQLALLSESTVPEPVRKAIAVMDGSETRVIANQRVYTRPDLPVATFQSNDSFAVKARFGGDSLHEQFVPAGQDACFASDFAKRHRTASGLIRALTAAINKHLEQAQDAELLAPNSPLASSHGTEFPIVQGPMTRVSDTAEFAHAVASAGGLPFLALALLRGPQVQKLITETKALLGDRPFGAGILGFVPPELREEQLEVLREYAPPFALIAGGRPSQARQLESQGTQVYLHVPSPGLLDLFLKEGSRRFIFEGRECGGHVGPRSSFVLWETQINTLLKVEDPQNLHVLFAGGIHNARSAAMVAAMAAPLAALGAKVGVLMGSAYLFTDESVSSGAIQPAYQKAVVGCDQTVLLETSPGHATRCVETEYVHQFTAEKQRLEAQGMESKDVWLKLEELNLGRLRIASKGVKRSDKGLTDVSVDEQQTQGMYMIGQVAALREQTSTIRELHCDVSEGSTALIARHDVQSQSKPSPKPVDIAIVGMAGVFPGAPNIDTFWGNIVSGLNHVTEVPADRWDVDTYFDPESMDGSKTPSKWGGFLSDTAFDPLTWGIPPKSLSAIEPIQLLSLEIARRALHNAGYGDREFDRERTSVIFGAEAGTELAGGYGFRAMYPAICGDLPQELDDALPSLTEDSFPGVLANVIAGRIANRLDLGGANFTVDAACASSLAAIDLGVKDLVAGTSEMVLCGGADLHNSINDYLMFSSVHALSRKGQCQTFDANADGIVLGEGVGVVVLKRLADAERDGDCVYAVIKGLGASSDGRSLGLTAPRQAGQVRALTRAYEQAGVSPADVGLVEAHGTGTVVGDRTELATLNEVYLDAGADVGSCVLGSVKSNIGHTKCAAGIAGMIKTALSLHHKVLPPTLNISTPNVAYDAESSPFVFKSKATPWLSTERHAALSAFGFGGTNFHAVLSEYSPGVSANSGHMRWPTELFLFRGANKEAVKPLVERVISALDGTVPVDMKDLAYTVLRTGSGDVQFAVVATDSEDLAAKLKELQQGNLASGVYSREPVSGKIALVMPGQGSQRPGMLADLFVAFPRLQRILELATPWLEKMYPPAVFSPEEKAAQKAAITDTRVAQPTLGAADLAMANLLDRVGIKADMLAGHSYGELAALAVAGVLPERELLSLSETRGNCILEAAGDDPGTMAAVASDPKSVEAVIQDISDVVIANRNGPRQTVISGTVEGIELAVDALKSSGMKARSIPVACAFHSPVVAQSQDLFANALTDIPMGKSKVPVWSNSTAKPYPEDSTEVRQLLAKHLVTQVCFQEQIDAMYADGARIFIECGPGRVLTRQIGQILGDNAHVAVACDESGKNGLTAFQEALAQLACCGVSVSADALFDGRSPVMIDLTDTQAFQYRKSVWMVNGHRSLPLHGELPESAMKSISKPISPAPAAAPSNRDTVVLDYLRTMREMVASQRDVMLGYLGTTAAPRLEVSSVPASQPQMIQSVVVDAPEAPTPVVQSDEDVDLTTALMAIVSERTGYPEDMLSLDSDLEADLSIDSIKRIEILGALSDKVGLAEGSEADRETFVEELAGIKTLRGIVDWLEAYLEKADGAQTASQEQPEKDLDSDKTQEDSTPIGRYLLDVVDAPHATGNGHTLDGKTFAISKDELGVHEQLAKLLLAHGATAKIVAPTDNIQGVDGYISLATLCIDPDIETIKSVFKHAQQALVGGAEYFYAATGLGGAFGRTLNGTGPMLRGGISGMVKTLAKEFSEVRIRVVDFDVNEKPGMISDHLVREMLAADSRVEVGYIEQQRKMLEINATALNVDGEELELDVPEDGVILITGGARGITAKVAIQLAERYRCKLELVGRTPLVPANEPAEFSQASTADGLRQLLIANGKNTPAEIERLCRQFGALLEVRATLKAITDAGASVEYHTVDVRDDNAFGQLIESVYERHGTINGVVYGAGIIEDKLAKHKTDESFDRVFDTKVMGALTLVQHLRDDVQFVVFFASVSGAFGNRGQVDYAAANDALDKLALSLNERLAGRVVSIDWGPWDNTGMLSEHLRREYDRRGISLIEVRRGVESLLSELAAGERNDAQVILMGSEPSSVA